MANRSCIVKQTAATHSLTLSFLGDLHRLRICRASRAVCRLVITLLITLGPLSKATQAAQDMNALENLVTQNTEFAFDLYRSLKRDQTNVFFSPFSISTAFALVYAGARGDTARQFAEVFRFPPDHTALHGEFHRLLSVARRPADDSNVLRIANGLWIQNDYDFRPDFLNVATTQYGATVESVDFGSQSPQVIDRINSWVARETNDKIQNLLGLDSVEPLTRLVVANATYFKGRWAQRFDAKLTAPADFWISEGEAVKVRMMTQEGQFGYMENELAKVAVLPYSDGNTALMVILPQDPKDLSTLEQSFDVATLKEWQTQMRDRKIMVYVPRFRITAQVDLKSVLSSMDLTDPFNNRADFSGIDGTRDLLISTATHKSFIEVDEEGSEAAAATGISIGIRAFVPTPEVRLDRPFLFLILDTASNSVLFLGRLSNPLG